MTEFIQNHWTFEYLIKVHTKWQYSWMFDSTWNACFKIGLGLFANMINESTYDLRLKWPYRMLMAGSSGCGKTTLLTKIVASRERVMTTKPAQIVSFYSHMQQAYSEIQKVANCPVKLLKGDENLTSSVETPPRTLVIIDDMQATHAEIVSCWFTRKSHHLDSSIIYLAQNVFDKSVHHRTISLNSTYIVLFKNPRDGSQVSYLDRQVFPAGRGILTAAYRDITKNSPHSYIVADFNQDTPDAIRLRNTLFPHCDFPGAFVYVPQ